MVGRKVAIVSDEPQTTRRAIRGVATREDVQIVLTDLPGMHRPRDELTRRMQRRVEQELREADAALFVLNGDQGVGGPGDQWIAQALARRERARRDRRQQGRPDRPPAHRRRALGRRGARARRGDLPDVGAHGERGGGAVEHLAGLLPEGPFYFPPEEISDQPE